MLAVPKTEAMDYVRYEGRKDTYPVWFIELINEGMIFERYRCMFYVSEDGDIAMAHGDVILVNKFGHTMYMESRIFNDLFYEEAGVALPKSEAIEYVVYEEFLEQREAYPDWIFELVHEGYLQPHGDYFLSKLTGNVTMILPGDVIFYNNDIAWHMYEDEFQEQFYVIQ